MICFPYRSAWAALAAASLWSASPAQSVILPPGVVEETLWTFEQNYPTALDALPDGRLVVGLRDGGLYVGDPDGPFPATPFLSVPTANVHEGGVLGLAVDPAFATSRRIYFSYVEQRGNAAAIMVKHITMRASDLSQAEPSSLTTVLELEDDIPSEVHYGGGLLFLADGTLLLGIGDDGVPEKAQDLGSTRGKVLRFLPDGSLPEDNPEIGGIRSLVYAYGLRNPFRIHRDDATGRLYVCDVGQQAWEEVNELVPGANYGWPIVEGALADNPGIEPPANYRDPALALRHQNDGSYTDDLNAAIALTDGLSTGTSPEYPAAMHNLHLVADWGYTWGRIFRLGHGADGSVESVSVWRQYPGAISDLVMAGGLLYGGTTSIEPSDFSQRSGSVFRFRYVGDGGFSATATAVPSTGAAPLDVNFEAIIQADDPDMPVSVEWEFGDGATSTSITDRHRFAIPGLYTARLTATDQKGRVAKSAVPIAVTGTYRLDVLADLYDITGGRDEIPSGALLRVLHPQTLAPVATTGGMGPGLNEFAATGGTIAIDEQVEVTAGSVLLSFEAPGLAPRLLEVAPDTAGALRLDATVRLSRGAIRGRLRDTHGNALAGALVRAARDTGGAAYRHGGLGSDGTVLTDGGGYFYIPFPAEHAGDPVRLSALPYGDRRLGTPTARVFVPVEGFETWSATAGLFDGGKGCAEFAPSGGAASLSEIEALFTRACIGCHGPVGAYAGLRLSPGFAWGELLGVESMEAPGVMLVEPGRPDRSYLVEKISCAAPQVGVSMPTGGLLQESDRQLVIDWIAGLGSGPYPTLEAQLWASRESGDSPVLVDVEAGITGGQPPYRVDWDFGDGILRPNGARRITYPFVTETGSTATYTVKARVTDAAGASAVASLPVTVRSAPQRENGPTPVISLPHGAPRVGRAALFDGTASSGDAPIVRWEWDFDGDGSWDWASRRGTAEFTYQRAGTHAPRLRVWDALNRHRETFAVVIVEDTATDPYRVLATLGEPSWQPASVEPFFRAPEFSATGGLGLSRPAALAPTEPVFGFWQTNMLDPLPQGTYRLRFHLALDPLPQGAFHPELRIRAFRSDNARSSMAVAAHLEEDRPLPPSVDVLWTSDGITPWRVAVDMISVIPGQASGYRVTSIEVLAP